MKIALCLAIFLLLVAAINAEKPRAQRWNQHAYGSANKNEREAGKQLPGKAFQGHDHKGHMDAQQTHTREKRTPYPQDGDRSAPPVPDWCQGSINSITQDGSISSPYFDDGSSYPNNANCIWEISAPKSLRIRFHFEDIFELEGGYDQLRFYEGHSTSGSSLGAFSGREVPDDVVSGGRFVTVVFHTDYSVTYRGWKASVTFEEVPAQGNNLDFSCGVPEFRPTMPSGGGVSEAVPHSWPWHASIGYINYDDTYHHLVSGVIIAPQWVATSASALGSGDPSFLRISVGVHDLANVSVDTMLHVVSLHAEPNFNQYSSYSYDYNGGYDDYGDEVGQGNDIALLKLKDPLTISVDVTPVCLPERGVSARGRCIHTGWRKQEVDYSYNYGDGYDYMGSGEDGSGDVETTPAPEVTTLQQATVSLEDYETCDNHSMTDVLGDQTCIDDGDLCDMDTGGPVVCQEGSVFTLHGVADTQSNCDAEDPEPRILTDVSYHIEWVESLLGCLSARKISEEGELTSPNYPYNYPNSFECGWLIIAPEGQNIVFDIKYLNVEYGEGCQYDALRIHDGASKDDSEVASLCGFVTSLDPIVTGSQALVRFNTDADTSSGGFALTFRFVEEGGHAEPETCSSGTVTLTDESGSVTSPGFPIYAYGPESACTWRIQAPDGYFIHMEFNSFNLEPSQDCGRDSLMIYEGGEELLGVYCGFQSPQVVTSSNNTLMMSFVSDGSVEDFGFSAHWRIEAFPEPPPEPTSCPDEPVVMPGNNGSIVSPGFYEEREYPSSANCGWHIQVSEGMVVDLHFNSFSIEGVGRWYCEFDQLMLFDGHDSTAPLIGLFCGSSIPDDVVSTGSQMFVVLKTDAYTAGSGFDLSWRESDPQLDSNEAVGCGVPAVDPRFQRIVGGIESTPHSWPWQISMRLRSYSWNHFCGGSIIAPQWVVTASHCVQDGSNFYGGPADWKVVVGDHDQNEPDGEQMIQVAAIVSHEGYGSGGGMGSDIALLRLARPITYSEEISPVCIGRESQEGGSMCVTTGWGATHGTGDNTVLQQVLVPLVDQDVCTQESYYGSEVTDDMVCAGYEEGGMDSCQGDSGGPLVCLTGGAYELNGITSWGYGCAQANKPGIYARVSTYAEWIESYTGELPRKEDN